MTDADRSGIRKITPRPEREAEEAIAEWLLPHRLDDLRQRLAPDADRYSVLGISSIVRSLLLDSATLEALSRRRQRLEAPTFAFTPYRLVEGLAPGGLHWIENGEPELVFAVADEAFTRPTETHDLRAFLKAPVGQLAQEPISVKEFVLAYAHVLGGVHLGRPKTDTEVLLQSITSSIDSAAVEWSRALQYIGSVTLRALSYA